VSVVRPVAPENQLPNDKEHDDVSATHDELMERLRVAEQKLRDSMKLTTKLTKNLEVAQRDALVEKRRADVSEGLLLKSARQAAAETGATAGGVAGALQALKADIQSAQFDTARAAVMAAHEQAAADAEVAKAVVRRHREAEAAKEMQRGSARMAGDDDIARYRANQERMRSGRHLTGGK
jgi:hypothetical protein